MNISLVTIPDESKDGGMNRTVHLLGTSLGVVRLCRKPVSADNQVQPLGLLGPAWLFVFQFIRQSTALLRKH